MKHSILYHTKILNGISSCVSVLEWVVFMLHNSNVQDNISARNPLLMVDNLFIFLSPSRKISD
jgi:hypothetical protein